MDPMWRRLVGSVGCAVLILYWMFGFDRLTRDPNDVANFSIVLAIIWIVTYRAWPAVEITWEFFTSPEAKRAYRPTRSHVLGALGLGVGLALMPALPLLMAGKNSDFDPGALLRGVVLWALILYIAWPVIVMRWRRLRTRNT